jgi:hypothetical protein
MLIADVLAAAAVTSGFGGYLAYLVGTPITANAVALIVVLGAILWAGVEQSVAVAMVLTGLEALGLAFVIVVGVPSWVGTDYLSTPHGFTGISGAAALIFFAYLGFDELGNCTWLLLHAGVTSVIAAFTLCGIILAVAWASRTLATGRTRKLGEAP